ncbi:MAG: DUF481 domain-containing protein [Halioglobus sp.]|nr:DUF481 domain-containing protein [Halioglobus sp.]
MIFSRTFLRSATALAGAALCSMAAFADTATAVDEIVLKDGSRILGKVVEARDGVVTVETGFAGTVSIELDKVQSLTTAEPTTVILEDATVLENQSLRIADQQLSSTTEPARSYPVESLSVINPEPWELGRGYKWYGDLSFALVMERGNTETDELDYKLETTWRSVQDRYRVLARGENDEVNGEKSADNWLLRGKWDYFLEDPNYWGFLAQVEQDEFRDLDLRWLAGPFIGRQFFDDPLFTLAGEFGVSYVTEEFIVAEDDDYGAANWDLNITSNLLGGDSQLYVHQFGLWSLDDTSDVVVDTTLGFGFPLLFNFEAAAEIRWEYDSGAVEGIDDLDQTYRVRIGYTW